MSFRGAGCEYWTKSSWWFAKLCLRTGPIVNVLTWEWYQSSLLTNRGNINLNVTLDSMTFCFAPCYQRSVTSGLYYKAEDFYPGNFRLTLGFLYYEGGSLFIVTVTHAVKLKKLLFHFSNQQVWSHLLLIDQFSKNSIMIPETSLTSVDSRRV